jgi:hypothetical protein
MRHFLKSVPLLQLGREKERKTQKIGFLFLEKKMFPDILNW